MNLRTAAVCLGFGLFLGAVAGCEQPSAEVAPPQAPVVPVSQPVQRPVTDYVDFTGRTDAVNAVNIVARVTGYIVEMPFKEGSDVKKDQLLFEIDPRPYQDQLRLAEAQLASFQAQLQLAKLDFQRAADLLKKQSISQQEYDQNKATQEQAAAQVQSAEASIALYKLNLTFCRVTSPIDGQVSRYYLTLGNLVNQDQTLLTTVVSLDPMYVYFDVDEPTVVRVRQAIVDGSIQPYEQGDFLVYMALQGEQGYPHKGRINFVNNQVNPATGSISVRGTFPNPVLKGRVRLLSPGMFVRVHLPLGEARPRLLVIDRAIGSDQGLKYVYVIDTQNKANYRRIKTGPLQPDGLRVITSGLQAGEWVAVGALQQIRPNMPVQAEKMAMPVFDSDYKGSK